MIVNQILAAKQANPLTDTSDLDIQIDELVYDLYGLIEDEKEIIMSVELAKVKSTIAIVDFPPS